MIRGTEEADRIHCYGVAGVRTVEGLAGEDTIVMDVDLREVLVLAGSGDDFVSVGNRVAGTHEHQDEVYDDEGNGQIVLDYSARMALRMVGQARTTSRRRRHTQASSRKISVRPGGVESGFGGTECLGG
ncbi:hypothetical protein LRE75_08235 [Streptomyces sp. 372A]